MQTFSLNLLIGATLGIQLEHFVPGIPTLWVRHVKNNQMCRELNRNAYVTLGVDDLYYFDRDACACFYDKEKYTQTILQDERLILSLPRTFFFEGSQESPLLPNEAFQPCQIAEIYNHGLDHNCEASVTELDYDYRTMLDRFFGFTHEHGTPNTPGFDEDGHFGKFSDECDGKVIHFVDTFGVVWDSVPPRRQAELLGMGGLFDNLDANGAPNASVNADESESDPQVQGRDGLEQETDAAPAQPQSDLMPDDQSDGAGANGAISDNLPEIEQEQMESGVIVDNVVVENDGSENSSVEQDGVGEGDSDPGMVTGGQDDTDSDDLSMDQVRQMMGVALTDLTPERESSAIDELANSQLLNRDAFIEYIERQRERVTREGSGRLLPSTPAASDRVDEIPVMVNPAPASDNEAPNTLTDGSQDSNSPTTPENQDQTTQGDNEQDDDSTEQPMTINQPVVMESQSTDQAGQVTDSTPDDEAGSSDSMGPSEDQAGSSDSMGPPEDQAGSSDSMGASDDESGSSDSMGPSMEPSDPAPSDNSQIPVVIEESMVPETDATTGDDDTVIDDGADMTPDSSPQGDMQQAPTDSVPESAQSRGQALLDQLRNQVQERPAEPQRQALQRTNQDNNNNDEERVCPYDLAYLCSFLPW